MVKSLIVEGKKAIYNNGILMTILGVFFINMANLWDEMRIHPTYDSGSVLYFWINRHSLGGIIVLTFLLCSLSYGIQFCIERENGAWKMYMIRENLKGYVISKAIISIGCTFLAFFVGYMLVFLTLCFRYRLFPLDVVYREQMVRDLPFATLAIHNNLAFFLLNLIPEIMMMVFLNTFSLVVATWTTNYYVVVAAPLTIYYIWNYFAGGLNLPEIFQWPMKLDSGFRFFLSDFANCIFTIGYYLLCSVVSIFIFYKRCKGDMENV